MKLRACVIAAVIAMTASVASAQSKFGNAGAWSPFGVVGASFTKVSPPSGSDDDSTTTKGITLMPGVFYFVADNLAVGGQITLDYQSLDEDLSTTSYGLAPMVGYNIPMADNVSLFPSAYLSYQKSTLSAGDTDLGQSTLTLGVRAPVLYHVNNFFLGIGPAFSTDLVSKMSLDDKSEDNTKTTTIGVASTLGGSF